MSQQFFLIVEQRGTPGGHAARIEAAIKRIAQGEFKNVRNRLAARWKPLERKTYKPRPTPG